MPSEPKRPEWMKVKANLGSDYVSLKNLLSEKKLIPYARKLHAQIYMNAGQWELQLL